MAFKQDYEDRYKCKWFIGCKGDARLDGVYVKKYYGQWLKSGDVIETIFDRTTGKLGFKINDIDLGVIHSIPRFHE